MAEKEIRVPLTNNDGLHARPARLLVQTAAQYQAQIQVLRGERSANAKSIISILKLGARQGEFLILRAEGDDAEAALQALTDLIKHNFDEDK